jgi:hypothetical protein
MRRGLALLVAFSVSFIPVALSAKTDTSKITIRPANQSSPTQITDASLIRKFNVWSGAGTSSNEGQSFIVDWAHRSIDAPPAELTRYEVSFYAKFPDERVIYVVLYAYDSSAKRGYVYFPGHGDKWYSHNVSTIVHGVEGKWLSASDQWNDLATSLIISRR